VSDADALANAMREVQADPGDPAPRRERAGDFAAEKVAARYLDC
jgi:hypothetical protein